MNDTSLFWKNLPAKQLKITSILKKFQLTHYIHLCKNIPEMYKNKHNAELLRADPRHGVIQH